MEKQIDVNVLKQEWFSPQPRLIICGGGHVAKEVEEIASHLDFTTRIIDSREDLMIPERFPHSEEVLGADLPEG